MSKNRPNSPPSRDASGSAARREQGVPTWLRVMVSLLLVWHLTAIFVAALSVPGSSQLAERIAQGSFMQYYLDALHLNQGHSFFAPQPPLPVTVRYQIYDERRNLISQGKIPDAKEEWPRLLYHRYFMLADQAGPGDPRNIDPKIQELSDKYLAYFARHLLRNSEGYTIRVRRVLQELVSPEELLSGKKPDQGVDHEVAAVTVTRRDLDAHDAATASRQNAAGWTSGGAR